MEKLTSLYTSGFLLVKNSFNYAAALDNFTQIANETVIAINDFGDESLGAVKQWQTENKDRNLKIIVTNYKREWPFFDGAVKDAARKACSHEWQFAADLDDRFVISLKGRWIKLFQLMEKSGWPSFLTAYINLWGGPHDIRFDKGKHIDCKWSAHLKNVSRGCHKQALLPNGFIDTKKSDGCDLLFENGELAVVPFALPEDLIKKPSSKPYLDFLRSEGCFVYHTGYTSFTKRVNLNHSFWNQQWIFEGNKEKEDIAMHESQLFHPTISHELPLWENWEKEYEV